MKKMCIKAIAVLFMSLAFAFNAVAASQQFCNQYALQAINQYQQGVSLGVQNQTPEYWSDNYQYHYEWCLKVPEETAAWGTGERQKIIDQKRASISSEAAAASQQEQSDKEAFCNNYASTKIQQYNQAMMFNLSGLNPVEGWHSDYQKHKLWCMTAPRELCLSIVKQHQEYLAKHGAVPMQQPPAIVPPPLRR